MPGPNDDLDLEGLDGDEGGDDGANDDGGNTDGDGVGKPADDGKNLKGDAKRIRDLQSKADAETARANKAEAALAEAQKRGQGSEGGSNDPQTQMLMDELRETALDAVYGEHPELKDYGIDRSLIEGTTRAQVRENAAALVSLIKDVATKSRNRALADAGVDTGQSSQTRQKPVDYASMSSEDFNKLLDSM